MPQQTEQTDWLGRASDLKQKHGSKGWGALGILGIYAVYVAITQGLAQLFEAILTLFNWPLEQLGVSVGDWIAALFGGSASIVQSGAAGSATWVGQFGPFAYIAGLLIALGGFYVVGKFLSRADTPDTLVGLGSGTDLPFIGADESDEEEG